MAYTDKQKADAVVDVVVNRMSWEDATEKYGCSKSTLSGWINAWKQTNKVRPQPPTPTDDHLSRSIQRSVEEACSIDAARRLRLLDAVDDAVVAGLRMTERMAKEIDGEFVRKNPAEAIAVATFVARRQDRLIDLISGGNEEEDDEDEERLSRLAS